MIHTKNIKFTRYGEEFEARVTWDDQPWKNLTSIGTNTLVAETKAFWRAQLIVPRAMDIKEHRIRASGVAIMGLANGCNDCFVLIEDDNDTVEWGSQKIKNIYPRVIEEILYLYYNEDYHAHYRRKVEKIKSAIDVKYSKELKILYLEKLALNTKSQKKLIRRLVKKNMQLSLKSEILNAGLKRDTSSVINLKRLCNTNLEEQRITLLLSVKNSDDFTYTP